MLAERSMNITLFPKIAEYPLKRKLPIAQEKPIEMEEANALLLGRSFCAETMLEDIVKKLKPSNKTNDTILNVIFGIKTNKSPNIPIPRKPIEFVNFGLVFSRTIVPR